MEPWLACPTFTGSSDCITLAHGEGGRLSRQLLEQIFVWLDQPELQQGNDAARCQLPTPDCVITCDSYVVTPLFFPGGDIGTLAVYGTVNDLAVSGGLPQALSLGLILEEGLPLATLQRILQSVAQAARTAGVRILTGDTKVVPRGMCDGVFVHTSGIGPRSWPMPGPSALSPGDTLLVSGPIGRHGIAVLAAREGLEFEPQPTSDCGLLLPLVEALHGRDLPVKALRDATRGGVAAVLHEWATACQQTLVIERSRLPQTPTCRGVAELLGLDLLHVACEGTMVVAVPEHDAEAALAALQDTDGGQDATIIGQVEPRLAAPVCERPLLGPLMAIDEPSGAPLPRIC